MSELQKWSACTTLTNDTKFNSFLQMVKSFDISNSSEWVKWKNHCNHCVIKTGEYFYKIYACNKSNLFDIIIRNTLAQLYQDEFNIIWDVITIEKDDNFYQLERRQPLQVLQMDELHNDDILKSWANILIKLEERLHFSEILHQIQNKPGFEDVYSIKLVRDNVTSWEDYAIINGQVILLDDADWFIAMLDKDGNWLEKRCSIKQLILDNEKFYFMPSELMVKLNKDFSDMMNIVSKHLYDNYDKWFLYYDLHNGLLSTIDFKKIQHDIIRNNIALLTTKK